MRTISKKEIEDNCNIQSIIEKIEIAYKDLATGKATELQRQFIPTTNEGDLLIGPAKLVGEGYFGVKLSSYTPQNSEKNLPLLDGIIALFSLENGKIVAILESTSITKIRTGAKSAVAAKYLANPNSKVLGILGMGNQAESHIQSLCTVFPIEKILLWSRNPKKHHELRQYIEKNINIKYEIVKEPNQVAKEADILISATWSKKPLIETSKINPGTLVIGLYHSPDAIEFKSDLLAKSKVFIDTEGAIHSGTIQNALKKEVIKKNEITLLTDLINKNQPVEEAEFIYFQSSGASIEDIAASITIYEEVSKND